MRSIDLSAAFLLTRLHPPRRQRARQCHHKIRYVSLTSRLRCIYQPFLPNLDRRMRDGLLRSTVITILINDDRHHLNSKLSPRTRVRALKPVNFCDRCRVTRALAIARLTRRRYRGLIPTNRVLSVLISVMLIGGAARLIVIRRLCRLYRCVFIFIRLRSLLGNYGGAGSGHHTLGATHGELCFDSFGRQLTRFGKAMIRVGAEG